MGKTQIDIETSNYLDMIPFVKPGSDDLIIPNFQHNYNTYSASTVSLGTTPRLLQQLGFSDTLLYDLQHFQEHMMPGHHEEGGASHGHSGTEEELRLLPKLLERPIAVVSADATDSKTAMTKDYRAIGVLMAYKTPEETKFALAIIQPRDFDNGCIRGYLDGGSVRREEDISASKILTYYTISEKKFTAIMDKAVANNKENLIYFNQPRYNGLSFEREENRKHTDLNFTNNRRVLSYAKSAPRLEERQGIHFNKVTQSIDLALTQYADPHYYQTYQAVHPYLNNLLDIVRNGQDHSLQDVIFAYKTCMDATNKYCNERSLVERKLKEDFAKAYCHHLQRDNISPIIEGYIGEINQTTDIDEMYDLVDQIMDVDCPTLEHLGIDLGDKTDSAIKANAASQFLHKELYNGLAEAADQHAYDIETGIIGPTNVGDEGPGDLDEGISFVDE